MFRRLERLWRIRPFGTVLCIGATIAAFDLAAAEGADRDWWSLHPVVRPELPKVQRSDWARNPIDLFVLAKLEERGLSPAPEASAEVLARRLHFDLIGLPPDPGASVDVDALLDSPHYGERWARHWLDVARFGESNGFEYDELRPNAWPYRDWVIAALNADMPYDRFARLQIAGDVLEPDNPEAVVATGFLVGGAFDGLKPAGDKQRKIMREDEMEDLVGTVSQTFLGLTVHCARCHDHKFDPIAQKEYFQIASALAGVHRGERTIPASSEAPQLRKELDRLRAKVAEVEADARARVLARARSGEAVREPAPQPIARWSFDSDLRDEIGQLHGQARGGARVEGGALVLDGVSAYVATAPLTATIKARTLEAWVQLDGLEQRGGAAMSIQGVDGGQFDAIVFGEREPRRWMSGSSGFSRTKSFGVKEAEDEAAKRAVHVAIVYGEDGTVAGYRNGRPYGQPYRTGVATYSAGNHQILFGLRHGAAAGAGRMLAGRIDRAQLYDRALTAEEVARSANVRLVTEAELVARLQPDERIEREKWKSEIARLEGRLSQMDERRVFAVTPRGAPVRHLLGRGSPFEPQEVVAAGGVAAVAGAAPASFGLPPDAPEGERRRKLAEWIAHPENPLFARVMMNRLWHYHFGQGLVKTPSDLGFSGGEPSHPDLLDWLAAQFRTQGWSLKAMHRLIVDSATYRQASTPNPQASKIDADNVYLWRYRPRRLEAELLRDAILKVSGELNPSVSGPGYRDFKMYKHKGSWVYDPIDPVGPEFNRRTIYRTWARGNVHPLLAPFDCPDPSASAPTRSVTTTPLGALSLLNTSLVLRMSDKFAERLHEEAGANEEAQAALGIALAFAREARDEEVRLTSEFIAEHGLPAFCRVLFNANEFLYVH